MSVLNDHSATEGRRRVLLSAQLHKHSAEAVEGGGVDRDRPKGQALCFDGSSTTVHCVFDPTPSWTVTEYPA